MIPDLWRAAGYQPHAGQAEFHASDRRFKLLVAGARYGKSLAQAREALRELLALPLRGWIVAPQYILGRPEFSYLLRGLLQVGAAAGARWVDSAAICRIVTPAGGTVRVMSSFRPEGLMGVELDWLLVCEAAHMHSQVVPAFLRPRLTSRRGRMVVGGTPRGGNWFLELWVRAGDAGDWDCFQFPTWDNPLVDAAEIESARAILPPETFDEQYGGQFRPRSGRVYPEFDRALHVRPWQAQPPGLVFRGIDFGYRAPSACLWLILDDRGRAHVLREHYAPLQMMDQLARSITEVDDELAAQGLRVGPAWADPSGAGHIATLGVHGIRANRAHNSIATGLDLVRTLLRVGPDGAPGLTVDPGCVNLVAEFENYQWADARPGAEALPAKGQDHALDALRYVLVGMQRKVGWMERPLVC